MRAGAEVDQLARDYFSEICEGGEDRGAFDRIVDLIHKRPAVAWEVIRRLLAMSRSEGDLAYIGSGPIEYLLVTWPNEYVDRLITEAQRDERLREAMHFAVIGSDDIDPELWGKLNGLVGGGS